MTRVVSGLLFLCFAGTLVASAQQTKAARIRFIFENPKLQPAGYVIDINEEGAGHFRSQPGSASSSDPETIAPQSIDTDIRIEEPLRSDLFKTARSHNYFNVACESTKSKVAFTGKKALQYSGPDGDGSCTFNWSHDQQLMKVVDDLIAVAFTIEEGRRLTVEHEHDRLSLDAELEAIAADEKVMERARLRARQLLAGRGKTA